MKDLTKGSPVRLIIGFALPVLLGLAFQQAYTLTDTIIVGQQLGQNSLAAIGSTSACCKPQIDDEEVCTRLVEYPGRGVQRVQ